MDRPVCSRSAFKRRATCEISLMQPIFADDNAYGYMFFALIENRCRRTLVFWPADMSATQTAGDGTRSEEHTSELQSLMRTSYAVFCLNKKNTHRTDNKQRE